MPLLLAPGAPEHVWSCPLLNVAFGWDGMCSSSPAAGPTIRLFGTMGTLCTSLSAAGTGASPVPLGQFHGCVELAAVRSACCGWSSWLCCCVSSLLCGVVVIGAAVNSTSSPHCCLIALVSSSSNFVHSSRLCSVLPFVFSHRMGPPLMSDSSWPTFAMMILCLFLEAKEPSGK